MKSVLAPDILAIFGDDEDPIQRVEERARAMLTDTQFIVWEGDPQTFAFSYVGGDAKALLGHATDAWISNASFWVDTVCHAEDREEAIAFCALATAKGRDHFFEYRAVPIGGGIVWLKDYVKVILGQRGVPVTLRGLMCDITSERSKTAKPSLAQPSPDELKAL